MPVPLPQEPTKLSVLKFNAKKRKLVVVCAINLGDADLVYVMSVSEVLVKQHEAKHLKRMQLKGEGLMDFGVLADSDKLVDLTWKPTRKDLTNSVVKGRRGRYLIMHCSKNEQEDSLVVVGGDLKKVGEASVLKIYAKPEIKHAELAEAFLVYYANRLMFKFSKDPTQAVETYNILLS